MNEQKNTIEGIQGLRVIAALLVLLQHSIYFTCVYKEIDYFSLHFIDFGRMGVYLFFVISGYVMTLCLTQGKRFMLNRIARIYPSFWLSVAIGGVIFYVLNNPWKFDFYSISLLPDTNCNNTYQVPYWTLIYEMFFYFIIYLFILFKFPHKKIFYSLIAWAMGIVIANHFQLISLINIALPGKSILFSPLCLLFISGALYGLWGREKLQNTPSFSLIINALLLFLLTKADFNLKDYALILNWSLTYVICLELAQRIQHIPLSILKLGDYSYGLYLMHMIFISVAIYLLKHLPSYRFSLSFSFIFCISFLGGVVFGKFDNFFYKKKIKFWLNKMRNLNSSEKIPLSVQHS